MKGLFEKTKESVENIIKNAVDGQLELEQFTDQLFDKYHINTPNLDKENFQSQIEKELVGFHNAPIGISFSPGQEMEYAKYDIPVHGDSELFTRLTKHLVDGKNFYFDDNNLVYKEYSKELITGNDPVINRINNNAKNKFTLVEKELGEFQKIANDFNEKELKPFIIEKIEEEKGKRKVKQDSERKLNPFI